MNKIVKNLIIMKNFLALLSRHQLFRNGFLVHIGGESDQFFHNFLLFSNYSIVANCSGGFIDIKIYYKMPSARTFGEFHLWAFWVNPKMLISKFLQKSNWFFELFKDLCNCIELKIDRYNPSILFFSRIERFLSHN